MAMRVNRVPTREGPRLVYVYTQRDTKLLQVIIIKTVIESQLQIKVNVFHNKIYSDRPW